MIRQMTRLSAQLALVLAMLVSIVGFTATTATAQTDVVGAADFRNAPILPAGQYVDRIVTGDTAWYSFVYTNNTPYEFSVSIPGVDLVTSNELELNASFVAPTLRTVAGPSPIINGQGVEYPNEHTNVWFLKVTLDSTETAGVEYAVLIDIEGVEDTTLEPCSQVPGCRLNDELATIDAEVADAREELDALKAQELAGDVQLEIENLRGFYQTSETIRPQVEARLARAEQAMAVLCAPNETCTTFPDPGSKTPLLGWAIGLAALGGGAYRAFGSKSDD